MNFSGPEILLVLVIVLIIFGAGKLPQVFSSLGKGVREFRDAAEGDPTAPTTPTTSTGATTTPTTAAPTTPVAPTAASTTTTEEARPQG
ncbi:MAG TPA: twin-arginine translocase TatA/TatE family subunit [Chloroflexia bacterium]|nr:twin-arginine translocase TatA/TatE family subunit [Chloroflexia bacterium]